MVVSNQHILGCTKDNFEGKTKLNLYQTTQNFRGYNIGAQTYSGSVRLS